jgi:uncharacterized protein YecE (DUF72 family)
VLLQLPPTLKADPGALDRTLAEFPRSIKLAVEPRHATWFTDETREVLEKRGAALCWADRRGRPLGPLWATAGFGYLRLHEGGAEPWPRYGRTALRKWLDRLGRFSDAYVYFNNDQRGAAVADAAAMIAMARRRGDEVSRPPADR